MSEINYSEEAASGTSWQRCSRIVIENVYQGQPLCNLCEERIYVLGEKIIKEPVGSLGVYMDPSNPLHLELYMKLNELYILLRTERDQAAAAAQEPQP